MRISVVIPTYNSASFIEATLDSVLRQTLPPDEILVLDDGSTDNTADILKSFQPKITVFAQKNAGVASARNKLCSLATGDLIAFLDHDDLWHPAYLQTHLKLWRENPALVASFLGHIDFQGHGGFSWESDPFSVPARTEILGPISFLEQYNDRSGVFGSASFLCVSKKAVQLAGEKAFCEEASGVDEAYLCTILPLLGPVAYCGTPLVAYRITGAAQSNNKLKAFEMWAHIFKLLEPRYRAEAPPELYMAFKAGFASKRRQYAKRLMGAGKIKDARAEFLQSLRTHWSTRSCMKSFSLFAATFFPRSFQPRWPSPYREMGGCDSLKKVHP